MLGLNYEPVGVPPWRVWPSCSSARSSTFLIAASFSESLIFGVPAGGLFRRKEIWRLA